MIISHRYKFIFIKTPKTAGTSLEVFLSALCGDEDIFTPIIPPEEHHTPRNYQGRFPLMRSLAVTSNPGHVIKEYRKSKKFFNHISASQVRARVDTGVWQNYLKFCIERNPWDKTVSHYRMIKGRSGTNYTFDDYLKKGKFCYGHVLYTSPFNRKRIIVDRVLRYELLDQELDGLFRDLGIPYSGSLDVNAKSQYRERSEGYRSHYNEKQKDFIEKAFATEIALHGYEY